MIRRIVDILRDRFAIDDGAREVAFLDTLIAVLLSQNTTDRNSYKAYRALRDGWEDWEEVSRARQATIARTIRVAGLADLKSAAIKELLRAIKRRWGSIASADFAALEDDELINFLTAVHGIGIKTATCAMMFALDRDVCAVDTHVHRVLNRIGIVRTSSPDRTHEQLQPMIPPGEARRLHLLLIHHGRSTCTARRPRCFDCPLYDLCAWPEKEKMALAERQRLGPDSVTDRS